MNQQERLIIDGLRFENKALKQKIDQILSANKDAETIENILCAALSGASTRLGPKEAADYAIACADAVMGEIQRQGSQMQTKDEASAQAPAEPLKSS